MLDDKRWGCTGALSVKEGDGTGKCEVLCAARTSLVPQSSRGLPAALIMAAGGFMNLRPAVIVDKLEAAYTDSATAQGRVLKKFLPSAAPQGRLRSQAINDVREAPRAPDRSGDFFVGGWICAGVGLQQPIRGWITTGGVRSARTRGGRGGAWWWPGKSLRW